LGFIDPHIREIVEAIGALINYGLITVENPSRTNLYSSSRPPTHHSIVSTTNSNNYSSSQVIY
jgi:hypothetical protein